MFLRFVFIVAEGATFFCCPAFWAQIIIVFWSGGLILFNSNYFPCNSPINNNSLINNHRKNEK